jgi:3-hydroxybutyryl-CoA dehydrogenase
MAQHFSTASVIGLGTVGANLTVSLARAGLDVVALEADGPSLALGRARVADLLAETKGSSEAVLGMVGYSTRPGDVGAADLVIEALPERLGDKCDALRRADAACPQDTVFVTTTTAHPVIQIAAASGRISRTAGLHLVNPSPTGQVAEVVATPATEPEVLADLADLASRLGRTAVQVGDRPGFIGGALLMGYLNSAVTMYERRYASRDDIDAAMVLGCGLPMGPLAQLDAVGLDAAYDALLALYERTGDQHYAPASLLGHMVAAGLLGRKCGRGFYVYANAGGAGTLPGAAEPADGRATDVQTRPVRRIGVIGSGTMAAGIAEVCARAGYPTTLVGRTNVRAKEAIAAVGRSLDRSVRRGRLTAEDLAASMEQLTGAAQYEGVADCDLVIEAVVEDLDVKRGVFAELDRVCQPGAVLTTGTSSLPVIECAMATGRPADVAGMHFFNPAPTMRLIELTRTVLTCDEAAETARSTAAALGKHPVACADRTGFIVNALLFPYLNRAVTMLDENYATADDIDTVMTKGWGFPMGPLRLLDVVGLDVSLAIQRRLHEDFREPGLTPARYLSHLAEAGHLGRKTGRGFRAHSTV